jgi:hypothetical protein
MVRLTGVRGGAVVPAERAINGEALAGFVGMTEKQDGQRISDPVVDCCLNCCPHTGQVMLAIMN